MIADLFKAFAQLSDRRFRRVVLFSCLLAALLLAALAAGAGWALGGLTGVGWLDVAAGLAGGAAALAAGAMLFPAAAAALQGLFLERAASAVEARHYPGLGPPRAQGWGETLRQTAFFAGAALGINLLLLPVWLFVPPPWGSCCSGWRMAGSAGANISRRPHSAGSNRRPPARSAAATASACGSQASPSPG